MKKTALFLSIFSVAHSLFALNVIHKESETSPALVRVLDVTNDYKYWSMQFYKSTSSLEWAGVNPLFSSKFYYYKLIIKNGSEDQVVVYNAQDQIKDSITKIKNLMGTRKLQFYLGFLASAAAVGWNYGRLFELESQRYFHEASEMNIVFGSFMGSVALMGVMIGMLAQLEELDRRIQDYLEVDKAFEMKEGFINVKTSSQNGTSSMIIVSDHELQTVEIDIQQRNEAYYEVTLTEINE